MGQITSLDSPLDSSEEETTVADLVPAAYDLEDAVTERIRNKQLSCTLWGLVDGLGEREAEILRKRYKQGKTLKQIAEEKQVSIEAIRQQERKAMKELRKSHRSRELEPFLHDPIYYWAVQGTGLRNFQQTWTSSVERIVMEEERKRLRDIHEKQ